jgi:cytoskeletal protein RodZ
VTEEATTLGGYLRAARRRRRIGIDRAAEETRIRSDYLMRMESDEFDFLATTYVRGFLKNYARYLRVDPEPMLREFDTRYGGGRVEAMQVASLERHGKKNMAAARPKLSSWGVVASVAAFIILGLAAIGLTQDSGDPPASPRDEVAAEQEEEPATPDAGDATPEATPEPEETTLAVVDGIEVEVVATTADCWVLASEDGISPNPAGEVIPLGSSLTFTGDKKVFLRLGYPAGVELIVNGRNIGSPGGENPIDLRFPQDLDTL